MEKIIEIDENTRIKIIKDNFALQYKIKNRNKRIAWHTDGYFPNLASLANEYINNAPYRAIQATERFGRLIETLKEAEAKICNLIINSKKDDHEKNN